MKEKALQEIVQIMQEHNLTIEDVVTFARTNIPSKNPIDILSKASFDVLIDSHGIQKRVPFKGRTGETILGLFPFKDDNHFLTLWEEEFFRKFADEERLPTIDFCERLLPLLPKINEAFGFLGKPILKGCYYARANHADGLNWIVGFDDNNLTSLPDDYYDTCALAKARYVGEFSE